MRKLKTTNNVIYEAKDPKTKELKEKVLEYIKDELKKQKMSRSDIIDKIEAKFKDEKNIDKIARAVADEITHEPLFDKIGLNFEIFTKNNYDYPYYFLGDDAKDPKDATKKRIKDFRSFSKDKSKRGQGLKKMA